MANISPDDATMLDDWTGRMGLLTTPRSPRKGRSKQVCMPQRQQYVEILDVLRQLLMVA
jgi:transposase